MWKRHVQGRWPCAAASWWCCTSMCSSILMVLHMAFCAKGHVWPCAKGEAVLHITTTHGLFHTNAMWKRPCTAPSSTGPPVLITSAKKIKYLKTSSRFIVLCAKNRKGKRNDVAHYLINKRGHYVIKERAHYLIMVPLHATFVKQKWHVVFISYCAWQKIKKAMRNTIFRMKYNE